MIHAGEVSEEGLGREGEIRKTDQSVSQLLYFSRPLHGNSSLQSFYSNWVEGLSCRKEHKQELRAYHHHHHCY